MIFVRLTIVNFQYDCLCIYFLVDWYPSFEILVLGNFDANNNRAITYSLHVYIN